MDFFATLTAYNVEADELDKRLGQIEAVAADWQRDRGMLLEKLKIDGKAQKIGLGVYRRIKAELPRLTLKVERAGAPAADLGAM